MDRIAKALMNHDEVYADISNVLFGDGADELISKLSKADDTKKPSTTGRNLALGGNAVAVAGGVHAVSATRHEIAQARADKKTGTYKPTHMGAAEPKAPPKYKVTAKLGNTARKIGTKAPEGFKTIARAAGKKAGPGTAAAGLGWMGLHSVELATDGYSNHAIRSAHKQKVDTYNRKNGIKKDSPDGADLHVPGGSMKAKPVKMVLNENLPVLKAKANLASAKGKKAMGQSARAGREKFEDIKDKVKKDGEVDVKWSGEISKVDDEKRQVFGYASVVEVNGEPVVDRQGDYISIDEVEKSAYDYVQKSRKGGNMHKRDGDEAHHVSDMIESFVITPEKIEKMGLPESTPVGWWIGFKVNDDDTWDEVKKGDLTDFSIHGRGNRSEGAI